MPLTFQAIPLRWKNRDALRLSNGVVEAVLLTGGGHLAELRTAVSRGPSINCLWAAPWLTVDPSDADFHKIAAMYGSQPAGPFLAGFTGHALCLDSFGPPSPAESALGIPLHGEAAAHAWRVQALPHGAVCTVELPTARLRFTRTVSLPAGSRALLIDERVENQGGVDRRIHWVQHVSLGPPLLELDHSSIHALLDRCLTWPFGYEGRELLHGDAEFTWPNAPSAQGGTIDLRIPFAHPRSGFVAAARVDPTRDFGYVAALNSRLGLALVYCFRRADFPWIAIWEENCARLAAPWNGSAQIRGMEFGTTPMPIGREATHRQGQLFDTPGSRLLAAGAALRTRYLACIATVPVGWREITAVVPAQNTLTLIGPHAGDRVSVAAEGLAEFFLKGHQGE